MQAGIVGLAVEQVLLDRFHQTVGIQTQAAGQVFFPYQRAVARRAVHLRVDDEQRAGRFRLHQCCHAAPLLQYGKQPGHAALAHLIGTGGTQQHDGQVGLLDGQALATEAFAVTDGLLMQFALECQLEQLVNFQPDAIGHRAVQLIGTQQGATEGTHGALDGQAQILRAIAVLHAAFLRYHYLVAGGEVVLQGLGQIGDLAWAVLEDDGLSQVIARQGGTDVMYLGADQFEHGQTLVWGDPELVDLHQPLIQLACGFTDIGLGQIGNPLTDAFFMAVGKAQGVQGLLWHAQVERGGSVIHNFSFPL